VSQDSSMLNMIKERSDKRAKEIIDSAKKEREQRLEVAKEKAEKQAKEVKEAAMKEYKRELQKAKASQALQTKLAILDAKNEMLHEVINRAKKRLEDKIGSKEYKGILTRLATEAAKALEEDKIKIQVPEGHEKYLDIGKIKEVISKTRNKDISIVVSDEPLDAKGGAVIRNMNNTKWVDNTFEKRIERMSDDIRQIAHRILFGEEST